MDFFKNSLIFQHNGLCKFYTDRYLYQNACWKIHRYRFQLTALCFSNNFFGFIRSLVQYYRDNPFNTFFFKQSSVPSILWNFNIKKSHTINSTFSTDICIIYYITFIIYSKILIYFLGIHFFLQNKHNFFT